LGVNYNGNAVFAADRTRARITTVNIQPVLGVKLNDQWSLGFGFQVQWINLTFEQRVSTLAPQLGDRSGDSPGCRHRLHRWRDL
ncbi:hypothetical protein, partial [Candidatus Raskinella chloraquaticus]|uniref:hypothetical protein n=1 Tax=Candidatus Raskinella chloraquaticus TaxID=1951219 RepID=UPI0036722C03